MAPKRNNADVIAEIEARFRAEAHAYAQRSEHLQNWVSNGNRLPDVYN